MNTIRKCTEVSKELVFSTFTEGFSDYPIQISMTEEQFFHHFFGQEGNKLEHSFIALDETDSGKGIGVVLGGIRCFDGKKTLRCGGLCVIPGRRGSGIAQLLLEKHMTVAEAEGCEQLFLEVLAENKRAIRFYEKEGYAKKHDLWYYSCENLDKLKQEAEGKVEPIDIDTVKRFRSRFSNVHMNWQNEMEYLEQLQASHFGVFMDGSLTGALSIRAESIMFLAVSEEHRKKGFAKALIGAALRANPATKKLRASFPDNGSLSGFYENLGFIKDGLYQHEMYCMCTK